MTEAIKFCTHREYINSCQSVYRSPIKGYDWAHVSHFCTRNCGLIKISSQHAIKWEQQCRWQWTSVARTYGSRRQWCYTLRLKLHRFDLSLYLLQACLHYVDNKSTNWSLSLSMHVGLCVNNRQVTGLYSKCALNIARNCCCLVITLGVQRDMVD